MINQTIRTNLKEISIYNLDDAVNLVWSRHSKDNSTIRIFLNIKDEDYPKDVINELIEDASLVGIKINTNTA